MLAWTRTSFALLANGALLTIKNLHKRRGAVAADPGLLGRRGGGVHLRDRFATPTNPGAATDPGDITPRRQVYIVGIAVLVLIAVTAVAGLRLLAGDLGEIMPTQRRSVKRGAAPSS